jgi:endonuclease YncB( thermonuclease family)
MRRVTQTVLLNNANRSVQELRKMDRSLESVDQTVNSDGQTKNDYLVVFSAHPGCPLSVYLTVAPEKKQAFGHASKKHLSDLIFDRNVTLDCGKTDKYRREICVVLVNGKDANLAQVTAGMAWWYRKYAREQTANQRADYEAAEAAAMLSRIGLWADPSPVPPWEWRHR